MATRYAVGTGVWDAIASWSDTSGGTTGFSVPVDGDDVKFDSNSGTITLDRAERCDSILFIGGGVLDTDSTGNFQLTVDLQVNFSTGGVMNCNTSDIYIGSTIHSSSYALTCTNGTFNGGDGEHWIGCIKVNSGGTCNLTSGITHINGNESTSSIGVLLGTGSASTNLVHNGGTVSFETTKSLQNILQYVDITLNNVIVDLGNTTDRLNQWANGSITTLNILGTLEIKKGKFDTKYASVQECNLTVSGTTTVGNASATGVDYAELVINESVIDLRGVNNSTPGLKMLAGGTYNGVANADQSIGSINAQTTAYNSKIYLTSGTTTIYQEDTGNHAWSTYSNGDVNIYHGNGTVKFTAGTYVYVYNNAVLAGDNSFYNVIIDHAGAPGNRVALSGDVTFSVINDLTVSDGDFYTGGALNTYVGNNCLFTAGGHQFNASGANNRPFNVVGTFTVSGTASSGIKASYIAGNETDTFGSLKVYNSGSFSATTGETIINDGALEYGDFGGADVRDDENTRFIHNNGTAVMSGSSVSTRLSSPEDSNVPGIAGGTSMPALSNTYGIYNLKAKTTSTFSLGGAAYIGISGDFDIDTAGYGWTDRRTRVGKNLNLNEGEFRIDGSTLNLWVDGNLNMGASTKLGAKRSDGSHPHWIGWMMCDGNVTLGASSELYLASGTSASDKWDFTGTQIGGSWINNGGSATE